MNSPQQELIRKMMDRAAESLEMGRQSLAGGQYYFASICAYAAVFHAMKALLETRGISSSKHGRVIGEINRLFVQTGMLGPATTKILDKLFSHRQKGFYSYTEDISEEEAAKDIREAEQLVFEFNSLLRNILGSHAGPGPDS